MAEDSATNEAGGLGGGETITTTISKESIEAILPATLFRLAECLPMTELDVIIREARACENALEKEIELLEAELVGEQQQHNDNNNKKKRKRVEEDGSNDVNSGNNSPEQLQEPSISIPLLPTPYQPGGTTINFLDNVNDILSTEFSPPDRYFTISALLGRLRVPLKLPATTSAAALDAASANITFKSKKEEMEAERKAKLTKLSLERQQALLSLEANENYNKEQPDTTSLLALWKRISSHRTSAVFRKPVNPLEAPGYTERILFPIDLSLIRKMIMARLIKSFGAFHRCVGLICHNCVKFNGRESDYAALTREFEDMVDEKVLEAVRAATGNVAAVAATPTAVTAGTGGTSSNMAPPMAPSVAQEGSEANGAV
jgi:hypothetical protein